MLCPTRICMSAGLLILAVLPMGCVSAPPRPYALQQSQLRARQLYQQNRALAAERNGFAATSSQLATEKSMLEQQYMAAKQGLDAATARLDNLSSSNSQLEERMRTMLTSSKPGNNPLSPDSNRRLDELRRKYKDFDFDPQTGVSKFSTDVLFALGSDELHPKAKQILEEFAQIMNQGEARNLKVLVSGHTDDKPVKNESTAKRHRDNLGLSLHRAASVARALKDMGVEGNRVGCSGYGSHQPIEPNSTEQSRQKNRRVEIYVLAPEASVASAWDPETN